MAAAAAARAICCEMAPQRPSIQRRDLLTTRIQAADPSPEAGAGAKIVLQPRLCTLRSYSPRNDGVVRADISPFFASLSDYVDNSRRSQDFETLSGRLAMIAFASAVGVEVVTGDSLFRKLEVGEMAGAAAVCGAVVAMAAAFAWMTSAGGRERIGQILSIGCNSVVDSLIDNLVDGIFFDADPTDWAEDL